MFLQINFICMVLLNIVILSGALLVLHRNNVLVTG